MKGTRSSMGETMETNLPRPKSYSFDIPTILRDQSNVNSKKKKKNEEKDMNKRLFLGT